MTVPRALILSGGLLTISACAAQPDTLLLAFDEHYIMGDAGEDPAPDLNLYERFNAAAGGDSSRACAGFPCTGWVEDKYADGTMKHRGYYDEGRLVIYKNFHPNGSMEREFKRIDDIRSVERAWHANGQPRSETRFADGQLIYYQDHYVTGTVRYTEERQRNGGCFTRMELHAADGKPISSLRLTSKAKGLIEVKEYHPGGAIKCTGQARCDARNLETTRIGTWRYFNETGALVREEDYIDGKMHAAR